MFDKSLLIWANNEHSLHCPRRQIIDRVEKTQNDFDDHLVEL